MGPNYCEGCGVEALLDAENSNRWICPTCRKSFIYVSVIDALQIRDAFGMHGVSAQTQNGLPAREYARTVGLNNEASGMDVSRNAAGQAVTQRTMEPVAPSPRDPQGERKRAEELDAVKSMLPAYNRLHGTAYDSTVSGEDDRGVDVVATSRSPEQPALDFQLTFVDTDRRLRASVARGIPYAAVASEEELLDRFASAVRRKSLAPDPDAVLVLDGAGVVTTSGTIDRFERDHQEILKQAPFREVWYVDQSPGGMIRRLAVADSNPDGSNSP
jgi:hypothetical protein